MDIKYKDSIFIRISDVDTVLFSLLSFLSANSRNGNTCGGQGGR